MVAFRGGGAVTALLDEHGQFVEFGVTSVYQSSRTGVREIQSDEIIAGRGETLEHHGETFLEKLPFFTCGARETQSSNLRRQPPTTTSDDNLRRQPPTTSHVSNLKEIADSQRGCDNP